MDKFEINYWYIIEECRLEGGFSVTAAVLVNNGTLRRYTLNNSVPRLVEEDSQFRITLAAINSVTRSGPSQPIMTTTAQAGIYIVVLIIIYLIIIT